MGDAGEMTHDEMTHDDGDEMTHGVAAVATVCGDNGDDVAAVLIDSSNT